MGMNCCKSSCWKIGLLVLVGIAALGWVVMALWNWLMPALFVGTKEIGYLQALGLLVLSKIFVRRISRARLPWALASPSLGTDDAGRAREIPGRHARLLRQEQG